MTGAADGNDAVLAADERVALIAAHERRVEALRDSAQYRVGELVIASARSPRRLVRLPVDLWRLRKELLAKNLVAPLEPATTAPGHAGRRGHDPRRVRVSKRSPRNGTNGPFRGRLTAESLAVDERCTAVRRTVWRMARGRCATPPWPPSQAGIPTVFWSKEDPAPLRRVRRRGASVSTGSSPRTLTCIERYVTLAGHDRVGALPFAVQPRIHNPIGAPSPQHASPGPPSSDGGRPAATGCCGSRHLRRPECCDVLDPVARRRRDAARLPPLRVLPRHRLGDDVADHVLASRLRAARLPHTGRVDSVARDRRAVRRHRDHGGDAGRRTSRRREAG